MKEPRRGEEETPHKVRGTRLPHLRAIRERRFLTQERLSELSHVSRTTIYRLEGGERGAREGTVSELARALGVSPVELVRGERYTWWRHL